VSAKGIAQLTMVANEELDPIFDATVSATEEAIVNALVAAETMIGRDDHKVIAIPQDRLREVMKNMDALGMRTRAKAERLKAQSKKAVILIDALSLQF
jgi:tellurite resistance protein